MPLTTYEESPHVRLFHGLDLAPVEIAALTAANSTADPEDAWREALLAYRVFAIRKLRDELLNQTIVDDTVIRRASDTIWMMFSPVFRKATGPMIAEAYIRAFRAVESGNVPIQLIYQLADEHAERVGKYFNETSSDALVAGFNSYVNRQVPQRAALEKVIDAYGLTPRQMSGYVAADQLAPKKTLTSVAQSPKRKLKEYIAKSIADRIRVFKRQEAHNLDEQAKQVAWMWLVENQRIPKTAQKMWLTANDEKVCPQCGPMHRVKVDVTDKFELPNGNRLFVPGAHVNCRCQVRLQFQVLQEVAKADNEFEEEHPRGAGGRFVRKTPEPPPAPEVVEREAPSLELEEMVRRAREQAAAERPREEAPPRPVLDIEAPAPRPTLDIAPARPRPQVRPTLDIEAAAPAEPTARPTLDIEAPVEPAPVRPRLELEVRRPEMEIIRPELEMDWERLLGYQDERQLATQHETLHPQILSPTRQITGADGTPARAWMVVGGPDDRHMTTYGEQIFITEDDNLRVLTQSERADWTRSSIRDRYDEAVAEKLQEMLNPNTGKFEVYQAWGYDEETEETIFGTAELSADIASELLRRVSLATREDMTLMHENVPEDLIFTDPATGEEIPETATWEELASYAGVEKEDFEVTLIGMENAYSTAVPRDRNRTIWSAEGTYQAANGKEMIWIIDGRPIPFRTVKAVPVVREELRYTRPPQTD